MIVPENSRRLAPVDVEDVRRHLQQLKVHVIIQESKSPFASPIVVARENNNDISVCIDYRTLNGSTILDQYTMPQSRGCPGLSGSL